MLRHGLNLKTLNFNAPGSLQMSRIASLENEKAILNLKKDKFLDNYFAVKEN